MNKAWTLAILQPFFPTLMARPSTEDRDVEEITNLLATGPKTLAEIRRSHYLCSCSESRPITTGRQLAVLAADGLVECRNRLYQLRGKKANRQNRGCSMNTQCHYNGPLQLSANSTTSTGNYVRSSFVTDDAAHQLTLEDM